MIAWNKIDNYDDMTNNHFYGDDFDEMGDFMHYPCVKTEHQKDGIYPDYAPSQSIEPMYEKPLYWKNSFSDSNESTVTSPMNMEEDYDDHQNVPTYVAKRLEKTVEEAPTICLVCGIPTNNFHYDVSSCNGCKTFFRRCVVLSKFYTCKMSNKCNIQHDIDGNPCKGCRLGKCIVIGMNPTAIQFPKHLDVEKVLSKYEDFKQSVLPLYLPIILKSPQESLFQEINELAYVETKVKRLRESTYNPENYLLGTIRDALAQPCVDLAHADNYEKPDEWPMSQDHFYSKVIEKVRNMILYGRRCRGDKKCGTQEFFLRKKMWTIVDNILVIDAAKTLPFFQLLDIDDQTALMKQISLVNCTLMEGFYSFKNNYDTIVNPDGSIPFKFQQIKKEIIEKNKYLDEKILEEAADKLEQFDLEQKAKFDGLNFDGFIELNSRIINSIRRVDLSETEYVLLKTLIYCYNALPDLSAYAQEVLQKEANKYSQLLLKYLQVEFGEIRGASRYAELISLISTFFNISNTHRQNVMLHQMAREMVRAPGENGKNGRHFKMPIIFQEIMHTN